MARPRSRPTTPLFRMIEARAQRESLSREALCRRFGISASYFGQLSADPELLAQASRPVIAAIAEFLEVPFVQAQLWAGQLRWEDFGMPRNPAATVIQYVDRVAMQIEEDPHFREFAVPLKDWSATPPSIRLRYVALYEQARALRLQREAQGAAFAQTLARAGNIEPAGPPAAAAPAGVPASRRKRAA